MRCSTVRTLLDDHVDGLLPADRASAIRAHLDACSACDQEFELLRSATIPLSAWGDLEPPPGCFERIRARIDALPAEMHVPAPPPPQASLRFLRGGARWLFTSGGVAAAVLIAAIAIERAGDVDTTKSPRDSVATRNRAERPEPMTAGMGTSLKRGEIPLTRARFRVTERLEQIDGLRRRRERQRPDLPADLAIPVSADPLGAGPR